MMAEFNITTPSGFFSSTIEPVFSDNIFSAENLSGEIGKPDLTPVTTLRQQIDTATNDKEISSIEFDAAASLARQKLLSDITSQDSYTRGKRDLEFNINAERDVQFQQGQQLLRDIDAYITASRATVVQREYEEQLEREEERLKEEKKEELQLMAMKLGVDPTGLSRKDLRKKIAAEAAKQYQDSLTTDRMGRGGSDTSTKGLSWNPLLGGYSFASTKQNVQFAVQEAARHFSGLTNDPTQKVDYMTEYINKKYGWATGIGSDTWYEANRYYNIDVRYKEDDDEEDVDGIKTDAISGAAG